MGMGVIACSIIALYVCDDSVERDRVIKRSQYFEWVLPTVIKAYVYHRCK